MIGEEIAELQKQIDELRRQQHAILTAKFPCRAVIYAYADYEALYPVGQKLGLTGEPLDMFCHHEEWELVVQVEANGTTRLKMAEVELEAK